MNGPTVSEVSDSYLYENAWGRPIGHLHESGEMEARERIKNTTACKKCGNQVTWVWHEGHRTALDTNGEQLGIIYEGGRLKTVPGDTHGLHKCR